MSVLLCVPTGEVVRTPIALAPPLARLRGARIGYLDNAKPNADVFLARIVKHLVTEQGAEAGPHARKDYAGYAAPADVLDELAASCDAVLVGTAD